MIDPNQDRKIQAAFDGNDGQLVKLNRQLHKALICARGTIRALHGPIAWDIYDTHSPEMRQINAALTDCDWDNICKQARGEP